MLATVGATSGTATMWPRSEIRLRPQMRPKIAAAYEKVVTTYDVTRLDMDIEDVSLDNTAAIDRRNQAIHLVQRWAERQHRPLQIVYTLPTAPVTRV